MKTVVLHGDVPENAGKDEQDVLVQARNVCESLTELGHHPITVAVSLDVKQVIDALTNIRPDFVFNLVESIAGRGHLIHIAPSIMDFLNIPYTGARTDAVYLTSNKVIAKRIIDAEKMPTAPVFLPDESRSAFIQGPYIIKSVWEHASVWLGENSIVQARDRNHLRQAVLARQKELGMACFAEPFIDGREFNLSLLAGAEGPQVLPPAEIEFCDYPTGKAKVVDYRSKWIEDSFEYQHTPRSFHFTEHDEALLQQLSDLAVRCWRLFGLNGYARVDFRVDRDHHPWILEINTNPCLSPDAGFCAALERSGLTFHQAMERIIQDAVSSWNRASL